MIFVWIYIVTGNVFLAAFVFVFTFVVIIALDVWGLKYISGRP